MLNRVVLIGRLARDPELKYTASGVAVATFAIAVDRMKKAGAEKEVDFINIVAWRQSAEFAANYLTKGRLVSVEGRLQVRSWVAQDGTKRYATDVVADQLNGLDKAPAGGGQSNTPTGGGQDEAPLGADDDHDLFGDE